MSTFTTRFTMVFLALCTLGGCKDPNVATQLTIIVSAETGVMARATSVRVEILGSKGADIGAPQVVEYSADALPLDFPLRVAVVPLDGDAERALSIRVSALEDGREFVAATVVTGFVLHRALSLRVQLSDTCINSECEMVTGMTCAEGVCVDTMVDPNMLVDAGVPGDAAVLGDAAVPGDAGVPDTGVPDTGVPDTGVPDTGVPDTGVPDTGVPGDAGCPMGQVACEGGGCIDLPFLWGDTAGPSTLLWADDDAPAPNMSVWNIEPLPICM